MISETNILYCMNITANKQFNWWMSRGYHVHKQKLHTIHPEENATLYSKTDQLSPGYTKPSTLLL
jgi:hypothetical protein